MSYEPCSKVQYQLQHFVMSDISKWLWRRHFEGSDILKWLWRQHFLIGDGILKWRRQTETTLSVKRIENKKIISGFKFKIKNNILLKVSSPIFQIEISCVCLKSLLKRSINPKFQRNRSNRSDVQSNFVNCSCL